MSSDSVRINEQNYGQWAIEAEASLAANGLWKYVTGQMRVPSPSIVPASIPASTPLSALEPQKIVRRFEAFNRDWTTGEINNSKAQGQQMKSINRALEPEYRSIKEPKVLWDKIKADIQDIIKLDSKFE